ncbi:MAG: hypothetical protein RL693_2440, partial [Verrucomicrobiota bacterium]
MHSSPNTCRRDFLQTAGLSILSYPLLSEWFAGTTMAAAAEPVIPVTAPAITPLNRFPRMMQDWLMEQVSLSADRGTAQRNALKTNADAEGYVKSVQERIRQCFGPPPEKTPLNARITRTLERADYRIENIIFESRPGYLVTGNLYLPVGRKFPVPGVIGVCGHSLNGKAAEAYQTFAQGLARQGMVCFIIDPAGQGERFQYLNDKRGSRFGGSVAEHIQMGNQQTLVGEFLGAWFAWDGIRALDYLLSRKEVDPEQVGVTGNSG